MRHDEEMPSVGERHWPVQQADGHVWKLRVTCAVLVLEVVIAVASLWLVQARTLSPRQPWALSALVAALGGLIGGLARALYFFSFDSYAFNHKLRTNESSNWAHSVNKTLDDKFDPLWVWYLWCLEPAMGAMVGVVLALAVELGLISLGASQGAQLDINLRLLVLGGMAGFFSEAFFERVRSAVESRRPKD